MARQFIDGDDWYAVNVETRLELALNGEAANLPSSLLGIDVSDDLGDLSSMPACTDDYHRLHGSYRPNQADDPVNIFCGEARVDWKADYLLRHLIGNW